jgi:hypothetical protein
MLIVLPPINSKLSVADLSPEMHYGINFGVFNGWLVEIPSEVTLIGDVFFGS